LYDLPTISNLIEPTAIVNSTQSEYSNTIIAGNFTPSGDSYGGGIRVTSLAILNPTTNKLNKTSYQYNTPGTANSSGVTSYLPVTLDGYVATVVNSYPTLPPPVKQEGDIYISWSYPNQTEDGNSYKALIYSDAYRTMELARDLPPPGVIYQYVTVTNSVQNPDEGPSRTVPGSTTYQFEVFRQNMVGITDVSPRTGPVQNSYKNGPYFTRNMAIMKFNASLGNLISSTTYDNNGQMLTQTVNHYLEDGLQNLDFADFMSQYKARIAGYNYQGYIQTRDSEVKILTNQSNSANNGVDATLSAREEYPSIQTGQTTINYVTGIETSTQNLAFDINSGEVTKTLKSDSYGNNFLTQITPAYTIYPFMGPGIGSSTYDLNSGTYNLNMLTQVAETKTYTVDANNNNLGLVSANITTWSDQVPALGIDGTSYIQNNATNGDVWRPQSTYNWMANTQTSNGLTAIANFTDYNFNTPASSDPSWKKVSQATLYDVYSHELEQNDINNNYSAMHMDYGEQKVVLTGSPANYSEIAYSGAEDNKLNNTNDIQIGIGGQLISGIGHTGTHCSYAEEESEAAFTYTVPTNNLVPGRDYEASVWVKPVDGSGDIGAATIFVTTDAPYIGPGAMSNFGDGTPGAN
ncbi:MAG TPA: hypothetical protein VNZ45_02330, partial [Bacteroidia bacterium]|nr:hypothetical protein [Bacteroidia bacterium]